MTEPPLPARTLVFGASGYVGSHLVPRLRAAGHHIRATARHLDVLEGRGWDDVELVAADALQPDTLDAALDGVEVAYYLVHSMAAGRDFARRDRQAAEAFRQAAERAGVRRIIYLGGLQPRDNTSEHLESRRETGEVLAAGAVPVIEVRAGIVVGPGSAAFEVIRDLVFHLPLMTTPRWVRSRSRPIALDDLLEYLMRLATIEIEGSRVLDVGGADTLRYSDMLKQFGQVVGRPVRIIPLPVLTPRLSSYWLDLVTAVPANVARPLIDGLRHDLLPDDAEIRALIPLELKTYRQAVESALEAEREAPLAARWSDGALAFRRYRQDVSFFSKNAFAAADSNASPEELWAEVQAIGGRNGWHYLEPLWSLRGLIDRAFGGIGMRRGRRDPRALRVGDAVDFWRVAGLRPGQQLTLVAEMKLPGSAVLEFEVKERAGGGSRLETTARFHPAGVFGMLYWYGLTPIHAAIFRGLTRAVCREAEASAAGAPSGASQGYVRSK
ncbi:MAG: SDR family oxidoreductase [Dehalococcoidia bacterium]